MWFGIELWESLIILSMSVWFYLSLFYIWMLPSLRILG
jgi:hypothetical protein